MESPAKPPGIPLTLFIASPSPRASLALRNIRNALERMEGDPFELEVVEVFDQPRRAMENRILVTPTLLARGRRVVGDLDDPTLLDYFLRAVSESS